MSFSGLPLAVCPSCRLALNAEGYLVAKAPFAEPVGPSFWERDKA